MNENTPLLKNYLSPPAESFWRWSDDGEAIEWEDGETIVFRTELSTILQRLGTQGLPRLGSVILLLAACRDSWVRASDRIGTMSRSPDKDRLPILAEWEYETLQSLGAIQQLPVELRTGLRAKTELVALVLEDARHRTTPKTAELVVETLQRDIPGWLLVASDAASDSISWALELRSLQTGIGRISVDTLRLRLQTGLDQVPKPADEINADFLTVRTLLREMKGDAELSALAALTTDLMGVVKLPRPLMRREELPVEGFSDITQRGSLDRLLLSELAHDDFTLSVRIALNEAIYLRRDSAQGSVAHTRSLLLDCGIRMWGTPRVLAAAVALAMAATSDRSIQLSAFRAEGFGIAPLDLYHRDGIVDLLSHLGHEAHPGGALAAWAKSVNADTNPADLVVITSQEAAADPAFVEQLDQLNVTSLYLATVDREGQFRLTVRSTYGSRLVRQATLRLDALYPRQPLSIAPLREPSSRDDFPVIFFTTPFPLLLPHNIVPRRTWNVDGLGTMSLTKDRRLMWWKQRGRGATQISEQIPPGDLLWATTHSEEDRVWAAVMLRAAPQQLALLEINTQEESCRTTQLEAHGGVVGICCIEGLIAVIQKSTVDVFDSSDGSRIQRFNLPTSARWHRDRYFQIGSSWSALSYEGPGLSLETITKKSQQMSLLAILKADDVEGPIGLMTTGDLWYPDTKEIRSTHMGDRESLSLESVSRDGRRALVEIDNSVTDFRLPDYRLIDANTGTSSRLSPFETRQFLDGNIADVVCPWPIRRHFVEIASDAEGLVLKSRGAGHLLRFMIAHPGGQESLYFHIVEPDSQQRVFHPFRQIPSPPSTHYQLRAATWPDGSRAILDSRGLLHLQSSDRAMPELTLVLYEGITACWRSDGLTFGPKYFTEQNATSAVAITSLLKSFGTTE